jgi:glycine/D-amino acid oxidase-like deaminating enzyme
MSQLDTVPVIVLGAGLAGTSTALELASRGLRVTLVDQDQQPVNRASLRNEGKIHIGLCYPVDETLVTASMQIEGALTFQSMLRRWIGSRADSLALSTPFVYAVAHDSVLDADQLEERYDKIESAFVQRMAADAELDYFGHRPERIYKRLPDSDLSRLFQPGQVAAAFQTEERAILPAQLARHLRDAISDHPNITFVSGCRVEGIREQDGIFHVEGIRNSSSWTGRAEQVVNALWDGRLALDQQLGMLKNENWLHRLKYRVIVGIPDHLRGAHSVTMVVGRYGDVVIRPDDTAFLSWYPEGLQGWTNDISPPSSWDGPCTGNVESDTAERLSSKIIGEISKWYPSLDDLKILQVDAGAIVACGTSDVDDSKSELHTRTAIGVSSRDGYHSLDPGKLTTAPLYGFTAAERVLETTPALA